MVHCTNRQKHSKLLVYQSSQLTGLPRLYQQCINRQKQSKTVKDSRKTVKTAKMTIGVPIVTGLLRLYQQCTNSVPIVKNSQKQSNSNTNRHMSTESAEYTKSASASAVRRQPNTQSRLRVVVLPFSEWK